MAGNKNAFSTHHPQRRNVTACLGGLKIATKLSPKGENPRDIAGNAEEVEDKAVGVLRKIYKLFALSLINCLDGLVEGIPS